MRNERQAIVKDKASGAVLFSGSIVLVTEESEDILVDRHGHFDVNDDSRFTPRQSIAIHLQGGETLKAFINRLSPYASGWRISFQAGG